MRAKVKFERPRRALLFDEMPVRFGDSVGIEEHFGVAVRLPFAGTGGEDLPVDDHMCDVNPFGAEVTRHQLGHPSYRELRTAEREAIRRAAKRRCRPGEAHRSSVVIVEHIGNDRL